MTNGLGWKGLGLKNKPLIFEVKKGGERKGEGEAIVKNNEAGPCRGGVTLVTTARKREPSRSEGERRPRNKWEIVRDDDWTHSRAKLGKGT